MYLHVVLINEYVTLQYVIRYISLYCFLQSWVIPFNKTPYICFYMWNLWSQAEYCVFSLFICCGVLQKVKDSLRA